MAWGIDIQNFSLDHDSGNGAGEFFFPTEQWNGNFRFASDHGLIMVASAGNGNLPLPGDSYVRPATRTPGTITVGALDSNDRAQYYSNYGDSVNVWAPTDIPVIPNPNFPSGIVNDGTPDATPLVHGGTSASAPFVSGILAMMRAVAPIGTLDPSTAGRLLEQTGWRGTGRVTIGVDAFAAVLAAMGGTLPNEAADAHATSEAALPLTVGPGGVLMPFLLRSDPALAALSSRTLQNWYSFSTTDFVRLDLQVTFYPLLGNVFAALVPDDADSRALPELVQNFASGFMQIIGVIAPGNYKLNVTGKLNLYEFALRLEAAPLPPDMFEPNDTFETATLFTLLEAGAVSQRLLRSNPGGQYDLSLHTPTDRDFFRITPYVTKPLSVPVVRVSLCDEPINVTLFDEQRNVLSEQFGIRDTKLTLPLDATCFLEISAAQATRYRMTVRLEIDSSRLPGPLQNQVVVPLPDLGDPALQIGPAMNHLLVAVDPARLAIGSVTLASEQGQPLRVALLDDTGQIVSTAVSRQPALDASTSISLKGLDHGTYVLRVEHENGRALSLSSPLNVKVVPSFHS